MLKDNPNHKPYTPSAELTRLMEELKAKRGDHDEWRIKELALMHFIADLDRDTRVFSRGEIHLADKHYPAVLIYDPKTDTADAWAQNGPDGVFTANPLKFFYSNIPHASHVREALMHETAEHTV